MSENDLSRRIEAESPTVRELAIVLFRQRRVFLVAAGVVFFLTIVYAIAGTTYRSHIKVLVRRGRVDPPVTAQPNAPPDYSRVEVSEEVLNSEVELLKDEDVLRRVVEVNNLEAHDWLHWLRPHESQPAKVERAVKKLAGRVKVEALKKTNLISVSYDAADPQLAADVLRTLAETYLEKNMEVQRPRGQLRFFDQQTAESRRQFDEAKKKLVDFTGRLGVVMAAQQRDLLINRLDNEDAMYRQSQVEASETERRVHQLDAQMIQLPERTVTLSRATDNAELLRSLKATLLDLELKKTQLLTKFEPSHRLVQEVEKEIQQAQGAVDKELSNPLRDETTDRDPNYAWAKDERQKAQVQLQTLEARKTVLSAHLAGYRDLARQLGEDAILQDDLISSEKAAEENYLLYVKKREEARMGDALDQDGIVNVAIAEQPMVPALPVWPAGEVLLAGFVAALTVGAGGAFAADYMDPALRTPEEALSCLEIPVLASIPEGMGRRLSA